MRTPSTPSLSVQVHTGCNPRRQDPSPRRISRRGAKARWWVLVLALLITSTFGTTLAAKADRSGGELLLKWRDGPGSAAAAAGNAGIGGTVKRNFNALGWQVVALPPGMSTSDGLAAYSHLEAVLAAEPIADIVTGLAPAGPAFPSGPIHGVADSPDEGSVGTPRSHIALHGPSSGADPNLTPNDPMLHQQWYLSKIGAPDAWAVTTGSSEVVVAVVDTGVDYTHPDLEANMWRNPGETGLDAQGRDKSTNGLDDDGNGYVDDVHGIDPFDDDGDPMDIGVWDPPNLTEADRVYHGTWVAGILGAVGDNGVGIAGVNWSVRIMAIRSSSGDRSDAKYIERFPTAVLAGLDYVLEMKRRGINVRVINHSYGGHVDSVALRDAYDTVGKEGILHVVAALNFALDQDLFPALPGGLDLPSVINVASSTESDAFRSSSNFGRSTVHLAAPGQNITSTWGAGGYYTGSGSSSACPVVAGAAALLLAAQPSLTVEELRAALLGSVDQPPAMRGKLVSHGRLNVARAMADLTNAEPVAIVTHASPTGPRTRPAGAIQVMFNRPMDRASVEAAFALTPPVSGTFRWNEGSQSFTYTPGVPLEPGIIYSGRIRGSALDQLGRTLDGDFDRTLEGSPADDFVWSFGVPAPHDQFAGAEVLSGVSGSVSGNNRYTYLEADEPRTYFGDWRQYGASLWYRWTAPSPGGWYTFELTGTSFDSLLVVYTGDRLDSLTPVAGNDNHGTQSRSRLSFEASGSTSYSILVAGKSEFDPLQAGAFTLRWYPTPPPGFTGSQFSPVRGMPGAKVTLAGTNFTGATAVQFGSASAVFTNALTNNLDLRLTATVPPDATAGPITIVTPHGSVTSTATFQVLPPLLTVRRTTEGLIEISWPATSEELGLESAPQLPAPVWEPVSALPQRSDGQSRVLVDDAEASRFFRLRGAP